MPSPLAAWGQLVRLEAWGCAAFLVGLEMSAEPATSGCSKERLLKS